MEKETTTLLQSEESDQSQIQNQTEYRMANKIPKIKCTAS